VPPLRTVEAAMEKGKRVIRVVKIRVVKIRVVKIRVVKIRVVVMVEGKNQNQLQLNQ
jgi:hypothetical protein